MKILAADTSSASGSLCLLDATTVRVEWTFRSEITHNRLLLKTIDQALHAAGWDIEDVEGFAVTIGPGSFTGLRIGLSTIKTLAWTLEKPLAGIPTLDAIAAQLPFARHPVCSIMDARKKEVFFGIYRSDEKGDPVRIGQMRVLKPEKLGEIIVEPTIFCGDGWPAYQDVLRARLGPLAIPAPAPCHVLRASFVADLARKRFLAGKRDDPLTCAPLYVRPSEAEIHYPHLSGHLHPTPC